MEKLYPHKTAKSAHGSTGSYIVGFILSLIFTIIPYYLVVNKVLTGNVLLAAILGFGVIQMFIQIFFFLHLGRGPKPLYNIVFFFGTASLIVVVIGASIFIMSNLYHNMTPEEFLRKQAQEENISQINGEQTGACDELQENHVVIIRGSDVNPAFVKANRCDTLTFLNADGTERIIMFGPHNQHQSYGGEFEVMLDDGRPETITLNQAGNFEFHDDLDLDVSGSFSVEP